MRHPNLFVIGAPKCGTTSLYAYLRQHPQVYLADPKEPNHFVYACNNPYGWKRSQPYWDLNAYLALFRAGSQRDIIGEASTCYSVMPHVAPALREHNPDAKIVAVLREPVQRAWSMYLYWHQFNPHQPRVNCADFRERFLADDLMTDLERQQAMRVKWLRGAGMYWENLQHFYCEFPAEQIYLLSYDDFILDPQRSLAQLCNFLGVENYQFTTNVQENKTLVPRFRRLYNFVNLDVDNPWRRTAKRVLGKSLPIRRLRHMVNTVLLTFQANKKLPSSLIEELSSFYRDDLKKLMDATGFDVRGWLNPRPH